jgi:hypothetical protein
MEALFLTALENQIKNMVPIAEENIITRSVSILSSQLIKPFGFR